MDKRSHTPKPKVSRRSSLAAPMAQQRTESYAGSTPQSLVRLIGCHDPAKHKLPGKAFGSRSSLGRSLIE
ncbi:MULTISPECIES: hypothetical protein [unclassified Bradyrhizobium]|uniref:hypothetical protein n=1 Tax=unclassified Bradyrhizobium TaxID=2631580 RepID=UPI0028E6AB38|nr:MULTISPECIES: hypothetical protein [unclassified Bradyrhizobium]